MLQEISVTLKIRNFSPVRRYSYFVLFNIASIFITIVALITIVRDDEHRIVPVPIYVTLSASCLTDSMPPIILASYAVCLWICAFLFDHYNQLVEEQLVELQVSVNKLRQIHEELCATISSFLGAFDVQVSQT